MRHIWSIIKGYSFISTLEAKEGQSRETGEPLVQVETQSQEMVCMLEAKEGQSQETGEALVQEETQSEEMVCTLEAKAGQ